MIRLSTLLLALPVGERLRARYDDYRQHGASWYLFRRQRVLAILPKGLLRRQALGHRLVAMNGHRPAEEVLTLANWCLIHYAGGRPA
jgi:hypothetical protein